MDMPTTPPRTPNGRAIEKEALELNRDPFDRKFLLSFDGGGIRGYAFLLILERLMQMCEILELSADKEATSSYHPLHPPPSTSHSGRARAQYLPAHYFDYIAGTSTGGLIAIMLGRLRMTVDECLERYKEMGDDIFGKPRFWSKRGPLPANRGKYSHRKLERAIKEVIRTQSQGQVEDRGPNEVMFAIADNSIRCRVIIPAIVVKDTLDPLYLFRTYEHPKSISQEKQFGAVINPGQAANIPIWQVARATTAAPSYFRPMVINDYVYLDGGFGAEANNPTHHAFNEVAQMHGAEPKNIALTVSIGTGVPSKVRPLGKGFLGDYMAWIKYSVAATTQSENTHRTMKESSECHGYPYERFNPEERLGDIDLGEWRTKTLKNPPRKINLTLATIKEITEAYLKDPDVQRRIRNVAAQLVETRRLRSQDSTKWSAAAAAAVLTS